jgi:hypothetical protein
VGVSILSGAFLNTIWPLLFLLRSNPKLGGVWKILLILAMIIMPIGIVMSYSRGAIIGLILIVVVAILLSSRQVSQPIILGVGFALLVFSWFGWDSQYFKFDWLQLKTQRALENPYGNVTVTERLFAYSEPFQHVIENPGFFFLGQGFAYRKMSGNTLSAGVNAANHAVFAAAYYGYGMLAAFAYLFLLIGAVRITWRYAWGPKEEFLTSFARAMLAGLMGFTSWFMLGHAGVDEPRGAMLLFFVFGLVAAQTNFVESVESSVPEDQNIVSREKFGKRTAFQKYRQ